MKLLFLSVLAAALSGSPSDRVPKFYPDDPVMVDEDNLDTPAEPAEVELSIAFRLLRNSMSPPSSLGTEAANLNTLDELPNSSWFTNRHGRKRMTIEELVRGPDRDQGPDTQGTWTVVAAKRQGISPGFQIEDSRGVRYLIKLDAARIPELASSAEVIATKLFYAFGYNVPENFVSFFHPDQLVIREGTTISIQFGDEVKLTKGRLRRLMRGQPRLPDGRIRVTASKFIEGTPIGPYLHDGTRSDDPNDVIPHEDRRDLRGLKLFSAWLNHDDSKPHNSLDVWQQEGGRRFVRHYLIDFGSCFGSGPRDLIVPIQAFHYFVDHETIKSNAAGFGFHVPRYRKVKWPNFEKYPTVGRWESEYFDPVDWRNDYPTPAFVRMTDRDAFWAAKIIMRFTRDELAAVVRTGQLTDPEAEQYFLKTLIERQQRIGRIFLSRINPLDEFRLEGRRLHFSNLSEKYGFLQGTSYRISWSLYDNGTDQANPLEGSLSTQETSAALPSQGVPRQSDEQFLMAEIRSLHGDHPSWEAVRVYLRLKGSGPEVVGIER